MRADLTVKDVMTTEYLGVSESDDLSDVATMVLDENASVVAVTRGKGVQGMVSDRMLLAALLKVGAENDRTIDQWMMSDPPVISPEADLAEAAALLADEDTSHLFVLHGDDLVGVLSENDMLTAITSMLTTESMVDEEREFSSMSEEEDESVDEPSDVSLQSVCEVCGTLKSDLSNFNGQLVCMDCRSV